MVGPLTIAPDVQHLPAEAARQHAGVLGRTDAAPSTVCCRCPVPVGTYRYVGTRATAGNWRRAKVATF